MFKTLIVKCLSDNYAYVCYNENNEAFVVDPSEYAPIKNFLLEKNLDLKFILNTHHHHDHIGGNKSCIAECILMATINFGIFW